MSKGFFNPYKGKYCMMLNENQNFQKNFIQKLGNAILHFFLIKVKKVLVNQKILDQILIKVKRNIIYPTVCQELGADLPHL